MYNYLKYPLIWSFDWLLKLLQNDVRFNSNSTNRMKKNKIESSRSQYLVLFLFSLRFTMLIASLINSCIRIKIIIKLKCLIFCSNKETEYTQY